MAVIKENIFGVSEIGVYLALNNKYFIYPPKINPNIVKFIKNLSTEIIPIETFIGGSAVNGSYIAMNSKGILLPNTTSDSEVHLLRKNMDKDFQIGVVETDQNAFGNLVLCNDYGAIISPLIEEAKDIIAEILQVPVEVFHFADSNLPGSCGIANNHGVVVHPMVTEAEADIINKILKVDIDVTTVNCGNPFIGGGCVVNDFGALFGRNTTGPEIQRIMEILQLD